MYCVIYNLVTLSGTQRFLISCIIHFWWPSYSVRVAMPSKGQMVNGLALSIVVLRACYHTAEVASWDRIDLHARSAAAMLGLWEGLRCRRGITALWKMPRLLRICWDVAGSSQGACLSPTIIAITCTSAQGNEKTARWRITLLLDANKLSKPCFHTVCVC